MKRILALMIVAAAAAALAVACNPFDPHEDDHYYAVAVHDTVVVAERDTVYLPCRCHPPGHCR